MAVFPSVLGGVGDVAMRVGKIYGGVAGGSVSIAKGYGSVGGATKLIFSGGEGPLAPFDPANPDWDMLGRWVKAGRASEVVSVGDTLTVSYGGSTMTMRVVGFDNATVKIGDTVATVPAIQMMETYTQNARLIAWSGSSGNGRAYSTSLARARAQDFIVLYDEAFTNNLGSTEVKQWLSSTLTDTVYDKMYIPSGNQLGTGVNSWYTAAQAQVEGAPFTYFNGIGYGVNSKRDIKELESGQSTPWWQRSVYSAGNNVPAVSAGGAMNYSAIYSKRNYFVLACNFIGKY